MSRDIDLTAAPHPENSFLYNVYWTNGDDDGVFLAEVSYCFLDLLPFLVARILLEQGYNLERLLVVRLRGADFEMMRAPLGAAAATPLVNRANPVKHPHRALKGEALR